MKNNPFKVGDRVRIYTQYDEWDGTITEVSGCMISIGTNLFHWKQCRRLVKTRRKTIWVNEYYPSDATTWSIHDSESSAKNAADREATTRIAVPYREVKVKK